LRHSLCLWFLCMQVAIALDTKGPEIRTGVLAAGVNATIELVAGKSIVVTTDDAYREKCDENHLWIDYCHLATDVDIGKRIYIDDGLLSVVVRDKVC
jgi:pyruvate kinase